MGIKSWFKKRKEKEVDGFKDNVNYEEVKGTASEIKKMATTILSPKETIKNARTETFQQAQMRLHVNDAQLIQNYKNYAYICYISLIFALFCFSFAVYYLFVIKSIISALAMISILLLCLSNAFKYSFRAFQIKHQKLCSVSDWWNRASEWLPKL